MAPCHDVVYVLPFVEVAEVASAGTRAGIVDVRGEVVAVPSAAPYSSGSKSLGSSWKFCFPKSKPPLRV